MMNRKMHMILTAVILLSACAWLPFGIMSKSVNIWLRIVTGIIGALAFVLLFERDMYLPFLADAAFPSSLLVVSEEKDKQSKNNNVHISIKDLPPNVKVVFWAAEPKDPRIVESKHWKEAYGNFSNAGVVITNSQGVAHIALRCPQSYHVSHLNLHKKQIPPHLHYRYELPSTKGLLSEVYTHIVECSPTN